MNWTRQFFSYLGSLKIIPGKTISHSNVIRSSPSKTGMRGRRRHNCPLISGSVAAQTKLRVMSDLRHEASWKHRSSDLRPWILLGSPAGRNRSFHCAFTRKQIGQHRTWAVRCARQIHQDAGAEVERSEGVLRGFGQIDAAGSRGPAEIHRPSAQHFSDDTETREGMASRAETDRGWERSGRSVAVVEYRN